MIKRADDGFRTQCGCVATGGEEKGGRFFYNVPHAATKLRVLYCSDNFHYNTELTLSFDVAYTSSSSVHACNKGCKLIQWGADTVVIILRVTRNGQFIQANSECQL